MNEWSFISATMDGDIISRDGFIPKQSTTVRDICTGEGWDIEHAALDTSEPYYWRLILSRPFSSAHRRTHLDDSVLVGTNPEAKLYEGQIA